MTPGGRLFLSVPGPTPPIFAVLESALARHLGPEAAAFVQTVFSLHDPAAVGDLLSDTGFVDVEARPIEKILPLPPPREFLWQYVFSTPLAVPAADLDDERRDAIEREVAAGSRRFVEGGTLVLRQPLTLATARR